MDKHAHLLQTEKTVARVLQVGVSFSVFALVTGWTISLTSNFESYSDSAASAQFLGLKAEFPKTLANLGEEIAAGSGQAVMVLGLLILILTPLLRVFASLLVFFVQRDRIYFCLTALVLGLLGASLLMGGTR